MTLSATPIKHKMSTQASEYNEHEQAVLDLQTSLLDRGVDEIEQEIADVDDVRERSAAFLRDRGGYWQLQNIGHSNKSPQAAYLDFSRWGILYTTSHSR